MIERTTVRLPKDLLNRARRKAAAEGRTLTSLIEDGLRLAVGERQKGKAAKRKVELPVSSATGGPSAGDRHLGFGGASGDGRPRIRRADEALQMILPDVNVLIYAFRPEVPQHRALPRLARPTPSRAMPASGFLRSR